MTDRYYTGVGSRQTPARILRQMEKLAINLRERGWILRSGHARGADRAFEKGAARQAVIYLPWPGFGVKPYLDDPGCPVQGATVVLPRERLRAHYQTLVDLGIRSGPATGGSTSEAVQLLHGRNVCQVQGHLPAQPPSRFVVCWTPGGLEGWKEYNPHDPQGGTATAILLADSQGIPVFNLARVDALDRLEWWLVEHEDDTNKEKGPGPALGGTGLSGGPGGGASGGV